MENLQQLAVTSCSFFPRRIRSPSCSFGPSLTKLNLSLYRSPYHQSHATFSSQSRLQFTDPRLVNLADAVGDEFAVVRSKYAAPKYPVILAHGLLGFKELHLVGSIFPAVQYWRGIVDALHGAGVTVYTTEVPPLATIEERATHLHNQIKAKCPGSCVNIIAHSMGGLDARYMISRLLESPAIKSSISVKSLTTIATPHRGSAVADFVSARVGVHKFPRLYRSMENLGLHTGAFNQLTRTYMQNTFNPATPDVETVRYFSYGAALQRTKWWSVFYQPHRILMEAEGPNDGLVSVASSRWGGVEGYKGTLVDVSHLDLINWTNRLRWWIWERTGHKRNFNALAFYLSICEMLAKEKL